MLLVIVFLPLVHVWAGSLQLETVDKHWIQRLLVDDLILYVLCLCCRLTLLQTDIALCRAGGGGGGGAVPLPPNPENQFKNV